MKIMNSITLKTKISVKVDESGIVKRLLSEVFPAESFSVDNGVLKHSLIEDFDLRHYQVGIPIMFRVNYSLYVETYLSRYIEGIIELMYIDNIDISNANAFLKASVNNIKEYTKKKINTLGSSDVTMAGLEFSRLFKQGDQWISSVSGLCAFLLGETQLGVEDTSSYDRTMLLNIDYSPIRSEARDQVKAAVDNVIKSYLSPALRLAKFSETPIVCSELDSVRSALVNNSNYGYSLSRSLAKLRQVRFGSMNELIDRADEIQANLILETEAAFDKVHDYTNLNQFVFGVLGEDVGNIALRDVDYVSIHFGFDEISGFDHSIIGSYSLIEFIGLCDIIKGSITVDDSKVKISKDDKYIGFTVTDPTMLEFLNVYKDATWQSKYGAVLRALSLIGFNLKQSTVKTLLKDYYVIKES